MSRRDLRVAACDGNRALARTGLVLGTFGNLSAADRADGVMAIKPSGVAYEALTPEQIVIVSLETGGVLEGSLRPSSDTATHLELYRAFASAGAVVHTHSEYATVFAQAREPIRCMGTTHADYFPGDIPVTRPLTREEVETDYERNTGRVIVEAFESAGPEPDRVCGVLVANHGPFTWGATVQSAIERAEALELVARLEWRARALNPGAPRPAGFLTEKHFRRKHGPAAYYGQRDPR
jgi:L-ribulose-5-phosphate 4-epimerase